MATYRFCPMCARALVPFDHEGRERLRCEDTACGFVHYDNPTPVVAAIVEHDGEIVLVQNQGWPAKWFGIVTGFLERDESPEEGMLREVREELGLEAEIVSLVGVYGFDAMNQVIIAWHVRAHGEIRVGTELAAIKRVAIDALRPWSMGTGQAVKDFLARRVRDT